MAVQAQFVPRHCDVFAGLDVDKKSIAVSFTDHDQLKQALRLLFQAEQRLALAPSRCSCAKSKTIMPPCAHWLSNGSASSGSVGRPTLPYDEVIYLESLRRKGSPLLKFAAYNPD